MRSSSHIYAALSINPSEVSREEEIATFASERLAQIITEQNRVRPMLTDKGIDVTSGYGEALFNGGMYADYVEKGHATVEQIEKLYNEKPFVISALRHANVRSAINDGRLSVEAFAQLSESEVEAHKTSLPYDADPEALAVARSGFRMA